MKVIVSILIFSVLTQFSWVEEIDLLISKIESEAKVVKSKNKSDA